MKHTIKVTLVLIAVFLLTQVIGLAIINKDIQVKVDVETGEIVAHHDDTVIGPRPETTGAGTFLYLVIAILIGTLLLLLLIKYRKFRLWKLWFFLAVWMTISISFGVFMNSTIALAIALLVALLKIYKPNPLIHNLSEVFMYAGIAVLLVPILNILWMSILLIAISIYDFIAVNKTKHMVTMAKFQTKAKLFAGFAIPYKDTRAKHTKAKIVKHTAAKTVSSKSFERVAILGGGDVAFPLLFSGVVMERMITVMAYTKTVALLRSFIIPIFVAIALLWLFVGSKQNKFYPAMPAVSIGCFVGYAVLELITLF